MGTDRKYDTATRGQWRRTFKKALGPTQRPRAHFAGRCMRYKFLTERPHLFLLVILRFGKGYMKKSNEQKNRFYDYNQGP